MNTLIKPIYKELEEECKRSYNELLEETWQYYYDSHMSKFPYVGGKKMSGTKNLTGAFYFVALGEVVKNYDISLDRWGYLVTECYKRYFSNMPLLVRKIAKKVMLNDKLMNKFLHKKDAKNKANVLVNPDSFETETQEPTLEFPIIYHTKKCPLHVFADKNGYMEYMPYLCNLDYVMFEVFEIPFYREKTCAAGDDCCDFKFSKTKPITPSWPCHILDDNDPLK